jgi:hypothetical protein
MDLSDAARRGGATASSCCPATWSATACRRPTSGVPALPHGYLPSERPDFYARERSGAGPVGAVVAYSTHTFQWGTEITAPGSARYSAHVSYRHADNLWTSRYEGETARSPGLETVRRASRPPGSFRCSAFSRPAIPTGPPKRSPSY